MLFKRNDTTVTLADLMSKASSPLTLGILSDPPSADDMGEVQLGDWIDDLLFTLDDAISNGWIDVFRMSEQATALEMILIDECPPDTGVSVRILENDGILIDLAGPSGMYATVATCLEAYEEGDEDEDEESEDGYEYY